MLLGSPLGISAHRPRRRNHNSFSTTYNFYDFDSLDSTSFEDPTDFSVWDSLEYSLSKSMTTTGDPSSSPIILTSQNSDTISDPSSQAEEITSSDPGEVIEDPTSTISTTDTPSQAPLNEPRSQEEKERRVFGAHLKIINRIRGRPNGLFIDRRSSSPVDPRRLREMRLFTGLIDEGKRGVDRNRLAEADPRSLAWVRPKRTKRNQKQRRNKRTSSSSSYLSTEVSPVTLYRDVVMRLGRRRPRSRTRANCK